MIGYNIEYVKISLLCRYIHIWKGGMWINLSLSSDLTSKPECVEVESSGRSGGWGGVCRGGGKTLALEVVLLYTQNLHDSSFYFYFTLQLGF